MQTERIRFANSDRVPLAARLDLPESREPIAYALVAHALLHTEDPSAVRGIARGLTDQGFGVLSLASTGLAHPGFVGQASDLLHAAAYLRECRGSGPALMIGHSFGGTATLYAARELPEVVAVATIGSPSHRTIGAASSGAPHLRLTEPFLDDLRRYPPESWLPKLAKPIMILHSPADTTVAIENAERLYQAVKHPKSFVSLDRADHLLSNPRDADFVAQVVGTWSRSLLARDGDAPRSETEAEAWFEPGSPFQVAGRIGRRRYRTELSNSRHHLLADEPRSVGGGDLGGSPFDYLLWALAACKLMTVRMYADRKGWPLSELRARLRHKKVKAVDLGFDPESARESRGLADHIEVQLAATGDLTEEQRGRLVEISRRCPVSRTLKSPTKIDVTLV